jgi:cytochrome c oxidase assembly factor CtaG
MGTAWAHEPGAAVLDDRVWSLRPEVVLPVLLAAALCALGWWRLRRRATRPTGAGRGSRLAVSAARRPALAVIALAALVAALLSPLDRLADESFAAHMLQHMLLIMIAVPAWLLADPFPLVVWGLPRRWRRLIGRALRRDSAAGRAWRGLTAIPPAWVVFACVLWGWHLPAAYDAALAHRRLHDLEHLTFCLGAVLFWWPVIHPAPRYRRARSYPARVVYLVLGAFHTAALGLLLTLAPAVLYRSYAAAGGPLALADQARGGVIMWGLGGAIDMLAILIVLDLALGSGPAASPGISPLATRDVSKMTH